MSVRKHGRPGSKNFGWQVRVAPFPAVTVPRKRDAERLEIDLKTKKALGHLHQAKPTLLGDELDALLERKKARGGKRGALRPRSVEWYERSIKPWEPLRATLISSLTRRQVDRHLSARARVAPVAARNELQILKQVLKHVEAEGQYVDKAILNLDPINHEATEGRALTVDDLAFLAKWMPERVKRMILFVGVVGLRFTEATNLTDQMLDLDKAQVTIPRDLNKSRRTKHIPLTQSEVRLLREQLEVRGAATKIVFPTAAGKIYTKSGFYSVWTPARKAAGLEGFHFHWLRHTAISLMAERGMAPEVIAQRVGHSDGGALIFRRYRHLFPSEISNALTLIDGLLDPPDEEDDE
jgi:integrase